MRLGVIARAAMLMAIAIVGGQGFGAEPGGPRPPQMDARFNDADGDLVADAPDPKQWLDPETLIFAYTPVEDPAVYEGVFSEFCDHLAKATGKKVDFFAVQSNAAQLESMRAGRLHITGFNTGSVPVAVNLCGFVPFCMMAGDDGSWGYQMEILVPTDSPIQSVAELRGKNLVFTAPTSNSGYKAPSLILKQEFGLEPERDYTPVFSGKHDNSILGVAHGDYEAACVANSVLGRMVARGAVDLSRVRSIYKSKSFPTTAYGTYYKLKPELAETIRAAFFSFQWAGTGLEREFKPYNQTRFMPITYKEHWAGIRAIDEALGIRYVIGGN